MEAEIVCEKDRDSLMVIHSYTPEQFRGKEVASTIMKEVIKYAKKNNLEIVPVCSFAVHYCGKHKC